MMKRHTLILAFALSLEPFATTLAQEVPSVPVAAANRRDAGDAGTNTGPGVKVDAVFAEYIENDSPGCALGVFQGGQVLYEKGYGLASLEHSVAIDPRQTVFDIGSVSKQFTAASLLLLVQDGKLALSDDIRMFVPEIPDYGKPITVAHLLHHTSGLRDYTVLMPMAGWDGADYTNAQDALAIIARQKALDFVPGSEFSYSNTGYFLISLIVERVSGKPLSQFAQERIFTPLGMKATFYLDDHHRLIPHRAAAYERNPAGGFVVHRSDWMQTGDGALQTTVEDLARWQHNFAVPTVGGSWLMEHMQARGRLEDGTELGYASGLFLDDYRGLPTIGHSGAWAGYRTALLRFPTEQMSIAVLCNLGDAQPESLARQVADLYLGAKLVEPVQAAAEGNAPTVVAVATPDDVTGTYWSRHGGLVRRIEHSDGKWWYVRGAQSRSELAPTGDGRFTMLGIPVHAELRVLPTPSGAPRKLQLVSTGSSMDFEAVPGFTPDATALSAFAGTYASAELDTRWSFTVTNGKLTVEEPREEPQVIEPVFKDAFLAGSVLLRFQRSVSGEITSLLVDAGGVRNLIFKRPTNGCHDP